MGKLTYPLVLDPCCGSRMFWFDRADERALFGDIRNETHILKDASSTGGARQLIIAPDQQMDFRALPFDDERFHLVVFDPPHLVQNGATGWLAKKYGKLGDDWREDIRAGFAECFRVLKTHGTLIFKWNEHEVKVSELLKLTDQNPLFGNRCGKNAKSHWIVFMKPAAPPSKERLTMADALKEAAADELALAKKMARRYLQGIDDLTEDAAWNIASSILRDNMLENVRIAAAHFAAREEGRQSAGERVEQEAWSYDLSAIPNGPVEVAFDGGLGMCNIQVCERRIVGSTLVDNGYPVPSDRLERAFFVEGVRIPDRGWRAYAWRRPTIPPLSPQAAPVEQGEG